MALTNQSSAAPTPGGDGSAKPLAIFRDGDYLVVPQRWIKLPAGCAVCGDPEDGRLRLKIRRASRIYALFVPFGAIVYFSAPTARLRAGLCRFHRNRELLRRIPTQLLVGCAVASLLAGVWLGTPDGLLLAFAGPVASINLALPYAIARRKLLSAIHSDRRYVWLEGVAPTILRQARDIVRAT